MFKFSKFILDYLLFLRTWGSSRFTPARLEHTSSGISGVGRMSRWATNSRIRHSNAAKVATACVDRRTYAFTHCRGAVEQLPKDPFCVLWPIWAKELLNKWNSWSLWKISACFKKAIGCFTCNVEKWPEHLTVDGTFDSKWFLINPYDPFKHNIKFKMYCLCHAGLTNSLAKNLIETVLVTLRSGTQFCLKYLVHSFARAQSR